MFIFYKMEYVIAYKMLLKESIDGKKKEPFLGMSLALRWEHVILLIFMSLCLASMTQHHFVRDVFFVTPMWNIPAPFNAATSNASCFCFYWTRCRQYGSEKAFIHTVWYLRREPARRMAETFRELRINVKVKQPKGQTLGKFDGESIINSE